MKEALKEKEDQLKVSCSVKKDEVEKSIIGIRNAYSMKSIMENELINGIFSVYTNTEDETEYIKCTFCEKWDNPISVKKLGIMLIEDSNYSTYESGVKKAMSKAFSNLKGALIKHIESQSHTLPLKKESEYNYQNKHAKECIAHAMRQHAYFALKSNMPFNQFENYLATSVSSGLEIGNINHTYHFIEQFLELVDKELIKMTATWFCEQKHVTITLDMGLKMESLCLLFCL